MYLLNRSAVSDSLWPVDCSLPGSSVPEVFHARILEWVAISFSSGSSPLRDWSHISCIGRRILYHCTTWEALMRVSENQTNLQLTSCQVGMDHSFTKYLLDASSVEGNGNPLQYSCLEKSHEQRSLAGYSPWGLQRAGHDWAHSHTHIGCLLWARHCSRLMGFMREPKIPVSLALTF